MTERKTPWTPGPWIAIFDDDAIEVDADAGMAGVQPICTLTRIFTQRIPNARLIAAAPTIAEKAEALAEAMQEAIAALNGGPNTEGLHEQCEAALSDLQAALAAAKGGDA